MTTRQPTIADAINFDHAAEFSYASYHAEKIAYLCLFRSTALTIKAYFFDEGSNDAVVVPHNHRYDFDTLVVHGQLTEVRYVVGRQAVSMRPHACVALICHRYDCIVDGGNGFSIHSADMIAEVSATVYTRGHAYKNQAHRDIHTLRAVEPGTILLLTQYADQEPLQTCAWSNKRPKCEDNYERMEMAEVKRRAEQLQEAMRGAA